MKVMSKKILPFLLAACMLISAVPTFVFPAAAETENKMVNNVTYSIRGDDADGNGSRGNLEGDITNISSKKKGRYIVNHTGKTSKGEPARNQLWMKADFNTDYTVTKAVVKSMIEDQQFSHRTITQVLIQYFNSSNTKIAEKTWSNLDTNHQAVELELRAEGAKYAVINLFGENETGANQLSIEYIDFYADKEVCTLSSSIDNGSATGRYGNGYNRVMLYDNVIGKELENLGDTKYGETRNYKVYKGDSYKVYAYEQQEGATHSSFAGWQDGVTDNPRTVGPVTGDYSVMSTFNRVGTYNYQESDTKHMFANFESPDGNTKRDTGIAADSTYKMNYAVYSKDAPANVSYGNYSMYFSVGMTAAERTADPTSILYLSSTTPIDTTPYDYIHLDLLRAGGVFPKSDKTIQFVVNLSSNDKYPGDNQYILNINNDVLPLGKWIHLNIPFSALSSPTADYTAINGMRLFLVDYTREMNTENTPQLVVDNISFIKSQDVTLDMNGVEPTNTPTTSFKALYGEDLTENSGNIVMPTSEGYVFDGYYDDVEGGNLVIAADGTSSEKFTSTTGITLYAHWSPKVYTVQYDANGGTTTPESQPKTYNVPLQLAAGIARNSAAGTPATVSFNANSGSCDTTSLNSDATISYEFKHWEDVDGGIYASQGVYNGNADNTMTAQWNESTTYAQITLPGASKEGYTFAGWYTAATGGDRVGGAGDSYTPTGDAELFAQWTDITHTVSYDANGGTTTPPSQIKKYGVDLQLADAIAKDSAEGTPITVNFDATTGECDTTSLDSDATINYEFKHWEDLNGGVYAAGGFYGADADNVMTAQWNENTTYAEIKLPEAYKEGFYFLGWYTASEGGEKVGDAGDCYIPTTGTTLFAQYSAEVYSLIIHYYKEGTTEQLAPDYSADIAFGADYSVPSPVVTGYTADTTVVTGTMDTVGKEITVYYTTNKYTLTIHYYINGTTTPVADDYVNTAVAFGSDYSVDSPEVTGHTPDIATITGTMDTEGKEITVYYDINSYILTWELGGGEITSEEGTYTAAGEVEYGTTIIFPTVIRLGFTFDTWTPENITTMPADDIKFTAVWLGLYGDINADGLVDATDALIALQSAVGLIQLTDAQKVIGDVDANGFVQATDALYILRKSAGKIDKFPVEN